MAKYCYKCGAQLTDDAKFCIKCGTAVIDAAEKPAAAPLQMPASTAAQAAPESKGTIGLHMPSENKPAAAPAAGLQMPETAPMQNATPPVSNNVSSEKKSKRVTLPKVTKPELPLRQKTAPANPKPENKSSWGILDKILIVTLAVLVGISAFKYPGFLMPHKNEPSYEYSGGGTQGKTAEFNDSLSDQKHTLPEVTYHSDPVDITPVEGIHITAEKDQLYEDTVLSMTAVDDQDERAMGVVEDLYAEGIYALGAWEFDGGLDAHERFPGEYTMSFDLNKFGIPEELQDHVVVYRVDDENELIEYSGELKNGTYQITGNQNSLMVLAYVGTFIFMVTAPVVVGWVTEEFRAHWYYTWLGDGKLTGSNKYGDFLIRYKVKDVDPDQAEKLEELKEIEEKYRAQAEEDFQADEEMRRKTRGSLYNWFNSNKSVVERLKEYVEKDSEYQRIKQEIKIPKNVQTIFSHIQTAYMYLGDKAMVRVPKGTIEFLVKKLGGKDPNMGEAVSHWVHKTYINIDMREPETFMADTSSGQDMRDNLLLTITHELFHICQDEYHFKNCGTSVKFDEMVCLVLEADAKEYYIDEGIITTNPALTSTNYLMTMFSSTDDKKTGDTEFQQRYGYLLSTFVRYLRDKTGQTITARRLMNARSRYKTPIISEILMAVFEFSDKEYDSYFRKWVTGEALNFLGSVGYYYDEHRAVYPKMNLDEGGIHVPMKALGSYVVGYREFIQQREEVAALLIVFDEKKNSARKEMSLVPYGSYEQIDGGLFVYPQKKFHKAAGSANRRMLEIYSTLGDKKYDGSTGYTIYTMYAPNKPGLEQNKDNLVITMPSLSAAAVAGHLDGIVMTVSAAGKEGKAFDITPEKFSQPIEIPLSMLDVDPENDDTEISVTLKEYVHAFRGGYDCYGPESEPAVLKISNGKADSKTYSGLTLASDSLVSFHANDKPDTDSEVYTYDPWPTNNTVTVQGDKVILDLGELGFHLHGHDRKDSNIKVDEVFTRDHIRIVGKVEDRYENTLVCSLTEVTPDIGGTVKIDAVDAEYAGEKVDYIPISLYEECRFSYGDLELDQLALDGTSLVLKFQNDDLIKVELNINGTFRKNGTETVDGKSESKSTEWTHSLKIELEKR